MCAHNNNNKTKMCVYNNNKKKTKTCVYTCEALS